MATKTSAKAPTKAAGKKSGKSLVTLKHTTAADAWATSEDRTVIFSVEKDGEVVDYSMPTKPNPGLALRYLRMAREQGELANSWLIETAVGLEGYVALEDELIGFEGDAQKLLRDLVAKIQQNIMGGIPVPKG